MVENEIKMPSLKSGKYISMCHTTGNDLYFMYNLGFGKLVIEDYRVKDYRITRVPSLDDDFGEFYVYCLLKGFGNDPDTIVKY